MNPKISVIIPVYNGAPFIGKTLQRAFAQECPAHEIIVVNDGSKDNTQEILDGFKDRIISKTIPNGGVANARNQGIRMATGEYVAFLDADDVWFRNKLKVIAGYIQKYPKADFFASDYVERIQDFGNRLIRHSSFIHRRESVCFNEPVNIHPLRLILENNYVVTPSAVVIKKSFVEQIGLFDPERKLVEDLDFYLRVAMQANFVLISDILLYKYNHAANMSFNNLKLYLMHKNVLEHFLTSQKKFIESNGFTGAMNQALSRICYMAGNMQFEAGNKKEAFALYQEALKWMPSASNFFNYAWVMSKKTVRLLINNKANQNNLKKIGS